MLDGFGSHALLPVVVYNSFHFVRIVILYMVWGKTHTIVHIEILLVHLEVIVCQVRILSHWGSLLWVLRLVVPIGVLVSQWMCGCWCCVDHSMLWSRLWLSYGIMIFKWIIAKERIRACLLSRNLCSIILRLAKLRIDPIHLG